MRNADLWRAAMNIEDRQEQWEGEEPDGEDVPPAEGPDTVWEDDPDEFDYFPF